MKLIIVFLLATIVIVTAFNPIGMNNSVNIISISISSCNCD